MSFITMCKELFKLLVWLKVEVVACLCVWESTVV